MSRWLGLRVSEWVLIGFFTYIALISPLFPDRPHLKYQPGAVLVSIFVLLIVLARVEQTRFARLIGMIRDWLPMLLTLIAFREMELFLPPQFEHRYEAVWVRQDHLLLATWHCGRAIESLGRLIPFYLELCYLFVYGLAAYCIGALYAQKRRESIDRFLTIYLVGTLAAYALFPYFPSEPPRVVFAAMDNPGVTTWARQLNLYILSKATIHVGVFPSAHVSSAFSAAWGMFLVGPKRKAVGWCLLVYAISVSVATIYGRYHYSADVLAGFGVSLIAGALCLLWRRRGVQPAPQHR